MNFPNSITPLILTFNEAPNIARSLEKLVWAQEIVVVDSFSTDGTLDLLKAFPTVRLVQRRFDSFAGQCNFGLQQIKTEWALSLDADYILSDGLLMELKALDPSPQTAGYSAHFVYCVAGRPLRASLYPPRTILYRKDLAVYEDIGHGHKVRLSGAVSRLNGSVFHDDRKPIDTWLMAQLNYAAQEARHLSAASDSTLNPQDRLRKKILFAPVAVLFLTLFGKGLIFDGWPGILYSLQRTFAELLLSLRLLDGRLAAPAAQGPIAPPAD